MSDAGHPCLQCERPLSIEHVSCPHCGFALGNGEAPEAWMGEVIDHKYEIEELLGAGGMGMVFRARRARLGDEVALKILFPHFLKSPLQRRLFQDEAIATAQLSHPNVIVIYDADIDPTHQVAYMAMELLQGQTFKDLMLAEAPMAPAALYPIFMEVCDGLSAAHEVGIVHRDLKPDNLFLADAGGGRRVTKVLDFGIATVAGALKEDESNKLLGTLRYMSPEQCRGEACGPAADLYALGVILYEALTRQRATGKTVEAILYEETPPLNERLPADKQVPVDLEGLVMELLRKDAEARPRSALEVRRRLKALADPFAQLNDAPPQAPFGARADARAHLAASALGAPPPPPLRSPARAPAGPLAEGDPVAQPAPTPVVDRAPPPPRATLLIASALCIFAVAVSYFIFR
ncbi:MAG: hypothetical protein FJ138_16085 [Deltaproteobacteria bacterium]|nr:hypothetical protein [Deltaproteobacteria bacterium]